VNVLVNRDDTQIRTNFLTRPLSDASEPLENLNDRGFLVSFSIKGPKQNRMDDAKFGYWKVTEKIWKAPMINLTNGETYTEFNYKNIPFAPCNSTNFPYRGKYEKTLSNASLSTFLCPSFQNLTLRGNINHYDPRQVEVTFNRCVGDGCATPEEMTLWYREATFTQIIGNAFFNGDNYD
jgi:hypothetical protein